MVEPGEGAGHLSVLIGGLGSDRLVGNGGGDLLIGGVVDFEDPTTCANNQKLCDLLHAWANPIASYDDRAAAVNALLAGGNGTYSVEVVDGATRRLVPVELGVFADGQVEVSGTGLAAGMHVEVPSS